MRPALAQHTLCAATSLPAASPRPCHRCHRSATWIASGRARRTAWRRRRNGPGRPPRRRGVLEAKLPGCRRCGRVTCPPAAVSAHRSAPWHSAVAAAARNRRPPAPAGPAARHGASAAVPAGWHAATTASTASPATGPNHARPTHAPPHPREPEDVGSAVDIAARRPGPAHETSGGIRMSGRPAAAQKPRSAPAARRRAHHPPFADASCAPVRSTRRNPDMRPLPALTMILSPASSIFSITKGASPPNTVPTRSSQAHRHNYPPWTRAHCATTERAPEPFS